MIKTILYFSISATIIIIAWIVSNVYHNYTNTTIPEETNITTQPITPSFDTKVIDLINLREHIPVDLKVQLTQSQPATSSPSLNALKPEPTLSTNISTPSSLLQNQHNNSTQEGQLQ